MRRISPLSTALLLGAAIGAAGIKIARRFSASTKEATAIRRSIAGLGDRLLLQEDAMRSLRGETAHTLRGLEIRLVDTTREGEPRV